MFQLFSHAYLKHTQMPKEINVLLVFIDTELSISGKLSMSKKCICEQWIQLESMLTRLRSVLSTQSYHFKYLREV